MVTFRAICFITIEVFIYLIVIIRASEPVGIPAQQNLLSPLKIPNEMPKESHCPKAEDIQPCECSTDLDLNIMMDCSNITSEEELKTVFSQYFPSHLIQKLTINHNMNLKAIRAGDLGNCSFVEIKINNDQLSVIENLALEGSYDTLETLDLFKNKLESIDDISQFKRLTSLDVSFNSLTDFPILNSLTLQSLSLNHIQIQSVPVEAIKGLPDLSNLNLFGNFISDIVSETFTENDQLSHLDLGDNKLSTIPHNTIKLHGPDSDLYLDHNQITNVTFGSFSGVTGFLWIEGNNLTELEEMIWRPLLEENVYVNIYENPFGCGCDIAWLITNRTLLDCLYPFYATCYEGTSFVDLDPAVYEEFC